MSVHLPVYYPNGIQATGMLLHPLKATLTQDIESGGTGSLTLGPDDPDIDVGKFVRMYTIQGDAGVYVISEIKRDVTGGGARTVTLQHAWAVLDRSIVWDADSGMGQYTAIVDILATIMGKQNERHWELGDCEYLQRCEPGVSNKTVRAAFSDVCSRLTNYWLDFDTNRYPFVVHVRHKQMEPVAELRLARNVSGLQWTLSTNGMFTRIWPRGFEELTLPEASLDRNVDIYGAIDSVQTNPSMRTEEDLRNWALAELAKCAQPIVQVQVEGRALCELTGEPLDRFLVGTACRVPLPQYGTTITENIVSLSWADVYGAPERVSISLANNRQTVASVTKKNQERADATTQAAGRSGGSGAKKDYIDELFGDPTTGVWARIQANQTLIRATVMGLTNGSQIEMNPDSIRQSIYSVKEQEGQRVTEEIGRVRLYVDEVGQSVYEIKAAVTNITGALNVSGVITANKTLVAASNLIVNGTLQVGGYRYGMSKINALTSWTEGSVGYTQVTSPSIDYDREDGKYKVVGYTIKTVVSSVNLPTLDYVGVNVVGGGIPEG